MASTSTKKANTQDQNAALMNLPSQSRNKIVAAGTPSKPLYAPLAR